MRETDKEVSGGGGGMRVLIIENGENIKRDTGCNSEGGKSWKSKWYISF